MKKGGKRSSLERREQYKVKLGVCTFQASKSQVYCGVSCGGHGGYMC